MASLFHYCPYNSFLSILENRTIMFSDITRSNDCEEIIALLDQYVSYNDKHPNIFGVNIVKAELDKQLLYTSFITACFSENRDSEKMWKRYGSEGICIEYNKGKLSEWCTHISVLHGRVTYEKNMENNLFRLGKVEYLSPNARKKFVEETSKETKSGLTPFHVFLAKAPYIKDFDKWNDENEWRISIPLVRDELDQFYILRGNSVKIPENIIDLTSGYNSRNKPCKCCFVPFEPDMIESITLAQNCVVKQACIIKELKELGFDKLVNRIQRSKVICNRKEEA